MRRLLATLALLSLGWLVATGYSRAQIVPIAKGCLSEPGDVPTACPPTLVPTIPVTVQKALDVTGPVGRPLGVLDYTVHVTSRVACFSAAEPVQVYTFGNPGAAVLRPATPGSFPVQNPNAYQIHANDQGDAFLYLELDSKLVGPDGMAVKAVWPRESVERIVQLIPPATPTPTPMGTPPPIATATPVATDTATPGPTDTPTPPVDTLPLATCLDPGAPPAGSLATLYVRTLPGAICSVSALFDNGATTASLGGGRQLVGPEGIAAFPFSVDNTGAGMGLATATCAFAGLTASHDLLFNVT